MVNISTSSGVGNTITVPDAVPVRSNNFASVAPIQAETGREHLAGSLTANDKELVI